MHVATLDLGGTKLQVGLSDSKGKLLDTLRIATGERRPEEVIAEAGAWFAGKKYSAVGVASFGPILGDVLSDTAPKQSWRGVDLRALLRRGKILRPKMPLTILQDVQAEVIAEAMLGNHGRKFSLYCYVTLSTGIGVGFYDRGRDYLYRSAEGGHVTVPATGPCICLNHRHCWEGTCSGTAMKLAPTGKSHRMDGAWIDRVAAALYSLHLVTNPDIIILGGGVTDALGRHQGSTLARLGKSLAALNRRYVALPVLAIAKVPHRALSGIALAGGRKMGGNSNEGMTND